jgi:hypothetical protein
MLSGKIPDIAGTMPAIPITVREITVNILDNVACINSKLHRMIFDCAARDLDVIEWDGVIREFLIVFVPFACD